MRIYFAIVHKEPETAWGISFPDLPGCISAADEEADLFAMAQEALALYAEGEQKLPAARTMSALLDDPSIKSEFTQGAVLIAVPLIVVGKKARYNVMLDPALVEGVDGAAQAAGVSRSEYIAKALDERLREDVGAQSARLAGVDRSREDLPKLKSKAGVGVVRRPTNGSMASKDAKSAAASALTQIRDGRGDRGSSMTSGRRRLGKKESA